MPTSIPNHMPPKSNEWKVGSGGSLDIESGATFQIGGVTTAVTAAELSAMDVSAKVTLFDDFLGDVLADQWSGAKGTDAQGVVPTVVAGEEDGVVRITCGDTTVVAESVSILTHGLNWKPESGGLVGEFKVRISSSIANIAVFVGFTDVLATTTLEEPFSLSGTTFTSNADDAVGVVFDTAATTDVWYAIGVKATVDTAATALVVPVVDVWETFTIAISTAGTATIYRNGTLVATLANAVTASVALTPVCSVMARTTATKIVDLDYVWVQKNRNA